MRTWTWASLLAFIGLTGCPVTLCTSALDKAEIELQKAEDTWMVTESGGTIVLLFTCPSGIGSAELQLPEGFAPCRFNVGLRYAAAEPFKRLEGFRVVAGGNEFSDPPHADGPWYMEVQLPDGVFEAGPNSLTIRWVDMYRY